MASGPDLFVVCKSCGSEVSPYITECPYCGTRLRKRAPKLERGGTPKAPRKARPRLGPLRAGEIPGIRPDRRPYVTIGLVLAWVVTTLFVYGSTGYEVAALAAIAIFGTLLERRHGWWAPLFLFVVGGGAGMALVTLLDESA